MCLKRSKKSSRFATLRFPDTDNPLNPAMTSLAADYLTRPELFIYSATPRYANAPRKATYGAALQVGSAGTVPVMAGRPEKVSYQSASAARPLRHSSPANRKSR